MYNNIKYKKLAKCFGIAMIASIMVYHMVSTFNSSQSGMPPFASYLRNYFLPKKAVDLTASFNSDAWAAHLEKYCPSLNNRVKNNSAPKTSRFLYDDRFNFTVCAIPKAATTNWRRIFLILSGKLNVTDPVKIAENKVFSRHYRARVNLLSDLKQKEISFRLKNYIKIMVVRNPFERLLSGYLDKFGPDSASTQPFHFSVGRKIIEQMRKNATKKSLEKGHDVKFNEFIGYILAKNWTSRLDEHWEQYHKLCNPCALKYDYIIKYEHLTEVVNGIFDKIGLSDVVKFPNRSAVYKYKKSSTKLYKYYKTLSPKTIKKIWDFYYPDFKLFNFGLPKPLHNITGLNVDDFH